MTAFAALEGHSVTKATVVVPSWGPWWAEIDLQGSPEVSGKATLRLGSLELVGAVQAERSGTQALQRQVRLVGGAGGWASLLPARAYHNDAGVKARLIAEDIVREAGEELADFDPSEERVGFDYVRRAGSAARALEEVIGSATWWVGYDGRTYVGRRPEAPVPADAYQVIEYMPRDRLVTLAVNDLSRVQVGSVISDQLDGPQTVRELVIEVGDTIRVQATCGPDDRGLARALRSIVRRSVDDRIYGLWRYRVVQMSGDRVELQAVRRRAGLPDVLPVSAWPGLAGSHAELTPGAEVLVQFIEGLATLPIVTHFAGKDGIGWSPSNLLLDATTQIDLGAGASSFVALATETDDRLSSIVDAFNAHQHVETGGTTNAPSVPMTPLASVAASKVRAE